MARGMTPKQVEINSRQQQVADLYLAGKTQQQIAEAVGVNQATISRDLTALQELWQGVAARAIDAAKGEELAKIDRLEREYWLAWEESRGKRTITSKKMSEASGTKRAEASTREEDMLGDPRFLAGVQWCIDRRCKILGVDAPTKQEVSGAGGGAIEVSIDADGIRTELLNRIARLADTGAAGASADGVVTQ
jgi:transcriptional regulator with XRE-family HTH domain